MSLVLLLQAALAAALGGFAWRRRPSEVTPAFVACALAIAWWSLCQALQIWRPLDSQKLFWADAAYFGIVALPPASLVFALRLTGHGSSVSGWVRAALALVPLATLATLYTNDAHQLFANGRRESFGAHSELLWRPGPAFWVHTAYSWILVALALALVARATLAHSGVLSSQMLLVLIAGAVPLLANVIRVTRVGSSLDHFDATPFALLVSVSLLPLALGRFRLLDLRPSDRAAAFANSPEALLVLDEQQRVTGISDRAAEVLALPASDIVGRSLAELLPIAGTPLETGAPDAAPRRHPTVQLRLQRGERERLLSVKVSQTASGAQAERVVAIRDDTARARALTAAAVRYQELFDEQPQAVFVHDPKTLRIVSANRAAEALYGWDPQELLQLGVDALWADDDRASLAEYSASAGHATPPRAARHRRRDGSLFDVELRGRATSFGDAPASILFVEDVTERRASERRAAALNWDLTTAAALWRTTVDALPAPLFVIGEGDEIFRLNLAAARLLGVPLKEAIGRPFLHYCDKEGPRAALALANEVRRTGFAAERHLELSGGRSWTVRCSPTLPNPEAKERRVVLILVDTTQLIQLQRRLDEEAAFARLGTITAAVAHDVRGPLAALSVNLDALEMENGGNAALGASLEPLHRSIEKINDLMQALLDYGRPAGESFAVGDLGNVLAAAVTARRDEAAAAGVTLEHAAQPGTSVRMERYRVQQAIENLLANAIQHSPKGASVRAETGVATEAGASFARCSVRDTGKGFRPEELPRVFEPFFSRRHRGTGLGLAIVHRIAEQHGGRAVAANAPDGGAVVSLELPLA